jgi:acetyltransferase-like isoleucine patch superfamily enzyme
VRKYAFSLGNNFEMYSQDGSKILLEIGRGTYPNALSNLFRVLHFDEYNWNIKIGAFCSIAQEFRIVLGKASGSHNYEHMSTYPFPAFLTPSSPKNARSNQTMSVIIGNDVWIGLGVSIMNNVIIGDGAVIGAYSVVRENIPPYAIAVGNPAKVVKYRFDEKYINLLLDLKWWNWSDEELIDRNASFKILRNNPESYFNGNLEIT